MCGELLPGRIGQADVMTLAGKFSLMEADPEAGHWYSPTCVRGLIKAAIESEREAYRKECANWLCERSEAWGKQADGSALNDEWNRAGPAALKSACWALQNEPPDSLR